MDYRHKSDRAKVAADGVDLSFVTPEVVDGNGDVVHHENSVSTFPVSGPAAIMATDSGNTADLTPFPSPKRKAFSGGLALAIVKAEKGVSGTITVTASASGLQTVNVNVRT